MKEWLKHKYALSEEGANDMIKACISVTITNIVYMMSAGILYSLIKDLLDRDFSAERLWFYIPVSLGIILLVAITNYIQYGATFLATYRESGRRRTTLAERLRKLPLSFFGKKTWQTLQQISWVTAHR